MDLAKHLSDSILTLDWSDQVVRLRKIRARDGMELIALITEQAARHLQGQEERDATLAYHVLALSKSLCDEQGQLIHDSDDSRKLLEQMSFTELTELGTKALKHSGFGKDTEQKKT